MCFGGGDTPTAATPAQAPAPPDPIAEQVAVNKPRQQQDQQNFGTSTPILRVDRSTTDGGATAGGTGLRM